MWAKDEIIEEKTIDDLIFLVMIKAIELKTIPPKAIKNFVPKIVPVNKLAKITRIIFTDNISL